MKNIDEAVKSIGLEVSQDLKKAFAEHLNIISESQNELVSNTIGLLTDKYLGSNALMGQSLQLLDYYKHEKLTQVNEGVRGFFAEADLSFSTIHKKQAIKIKRTVDADELKESSTDSAAEAKSKARLRFKKAVGLGTAIQVPMRDVVGFRFNLLGAQLLLKFQKKITEASGQWFTDWAYLVEKSITVETSNAEVEFASLKRLTEEHEQYLKCYLQKALDLLVSEMFADGSLISVYKLRKANQQRTEEVTLAKSQLKEATATWRKQITAYLEKTELYIYLAQMKVNVRNELSRIEENVVQHVFNVVKKEADGAKLLLEEIDKCIIDKSYELAEAVNLELDDRFVLDEIQVKQSLDLLQELAHSIPTKMTINYQNDTVELDTAFMADYVLDVIVDNPIHAVLLGLPVRCASAMAPLTSSLRMIEHGIASRSEIDNWPVVFQHSKEQAEQNASNALDALSEIEAKFVAQINEIRTDVETYFSIEHLVQEAGMHEVDSTLINKISIADKLYNGISGRAQRFFSKYISLITTTQDELNYAEFKAVNSKMESLNARLRSFTESVSPPLKAIQSLPFYYQQLFIGKHAPRENLFLYREKEMNLARLGVERLKAGSGGAIAVLGDALSGKTFFSEMMCQKLISGKVFQINAPMRGSSNPENFIRALSHRLQSTGIDVDVIEMAPKGSVFLFNDFELWWNRYEDGYRVLELFSKMVERYSQSYIFIINLNSSAYQLMNRYMSFEDNFIQTIPLRPFSVKQMTNAIEARHKAGGLQLWLNGEQIGPNSGNKIKELADDLIEFSDGNVGAAFHLWLGHLVEVEGEIMKMRSAKYRELPEIDNKEWLVILAQIILHKHITAKKLSRIMRSTDYEATLVLNHMKRSGILDELLGETYRVSPYVHPFVLRRLKQLKLI
ncbi:MAG: hypothetical protein KDC83_02020 [Flavobacteriales bacterium]|nr:hypothetical protein [Flavobacteriales bacterium]